MMNPFYFEDDGDAESNDGIDDLLEQLRPADTENRGQIGNSAFVPPSSGPDSDIDDNQFANNALKSRLSSSSSSSSLSDLSLPLALHRLMISLRPSSTSADDEDEDDFVTLRAVQKRFSDIEKQLNCNNYVDKLDCHKVQVRSQLSALLEQKSSSNKLFVNGTNDACKSFPDFQKLDFVERHRPDEQSSLPPLNNSSALASARLLLDAIKKNKSCQKFLQSKLIHIEAMIEQNKKLKVAVKTLNRFQTSCRKRTGRALSRMKDPRLRLISTTPSQVDGRKASQKYSAPEENDHVAKYRTVLQKYPVILQQEKWSEEERKNLRKGIVQEFQKAVLCSGESSGISGDIDELMTGIRNLENCPEKIRAYIPKVDWEKFAFDYLKGRRNGAECEARWLNWEDPLINHEKWTRAEDKILMLMAEQNRMENWIDIAVALRTRRTPFQCLARYQRSLNPAMLNRDWIKEEDDKLRGLVRTFGIGDWQLIASKLERRTGVQCSNRWIKSLNPARLRVGRWTVEEDTRLRISVMLFGAKTWNKISEFVLGRTQVQCRERWVNSLDPALNMGEWGVEEDETLLKAIKEHGYRWSKVAACVAPRTDSQCRRRWKLLCPDEVPKLQAVKKIQRVALISNFVDRQSERPCLAPDDFAPLPAICSPEEGKKRKRKSRNVGRKPLESNLSGHQRMLKPVIQLTN